MAEEKTLIELETELYEYDPASLLIRAKQYIQIEISDPIHPFFYPLIVKAAYDVGRGVVTEAVAQYVAKWEGKDLMRK